MRSRKLTIFCLLSLAAATNATEITFTKINEAEAKEIQKYWQLSDREIQRYKEVMTSEGQFRYPQLTPLEVLGITAPNEETMQYYAKKAASYEFKAVQAQLKYVAMVTEEKTKLWKEYKKEINEANVKAEHKAAKDKQLRDEIEALTSGKSEDTNTNKEAKATK